MTKIRPDNLAAAAKILEGMFGPGRNSTFDRASFAVQTWEKLARGDMHIDPLHPKVRLWLVNIVAEAMHQEAITQPKRGAKK